MLEDCYTDIRTEENKEDIEERVYIRLQHKELGYTVEGYDRIRHQDALLKRLTDRMANIVECFRQTDGELYNPNRVKTTELETND